MTCRRHQLGLALAMLLATFVDARAATVVLQPSNQDAFVQQDKPNRIASGKLQNQRIRVQSSLLSIPRLRHGLVQFDLSAIPTGATIESAILALHEANNADNPRLHGAFRITAGWLQSTVKWNNQPAALATATDTVAVGSGRGTRLLDVTADVQTFVDAPALNHGWLVKDTDEVVPTTAGIAEVTYNARAEDHIPDLPNRPQLTVTFDAPPCDTDADCADGNACTMNEHCQDGFCAVTPVVCDDGNLCTDDICDPTVGCLYPLGECDDGFDCTTDTCNPQTGACAHTPVNAVCAGQCGTGTCVADPDRSDIDSTTGCLVSGTAPAGTPCNADGNPCTDDVCDASGHCGVPNTAPCSDGNACTTGDHCAAGQCTSGTPTVCTALDQCHDAGTCNPLTGVCPNPPKSPGALCDDGDACTQTDQCNGLGTCVGSNFVVCTPLDACHQGGTCDSGSGECSNPPAPVGTLCTDGDACTQTDQCNGQGTCVGTNPVVCSALDQCHDAGTCDPASGQCSSPAKTAGASCDDGSACTQTDACDGAGTCVGSDPVVCAALDQCHDAGTCNPASGQCSNPAKTAGASCDDGNACTRTDACDGAGSCAGTDAVTCTPVDQCHDAGTCDPATGVCSAPAKPADSACDDGDACTQTDRCDAAGTCVGANPVVCTTLDQCHETGTCDPASGQCSNPPVSDGTSCSDGNACTLGDTCRNGGCISGISAMCGDGATQTACGEQCDTGGVPGGDCDTHCQFICGPTPAVGCHQPIAHKKSLFVLGDNPKDKNDRLAWTWNKGSATPKSEFGSPLTDTEYTLCVYDGAAASQPVLRATIPAGGQCGKKPCWKAYKLGFKYRGNKAHTPDGIAALVLKSGIDGKARLALTGRGVPLAMPSLPSLQSPVTVQLINSAGGCWQAVFSAPFKRQKPKLFRDVAD